MSSKNAVDSRVQMTGLDDLHSVHVNVPTNTELLIQVKLCFNVFILLPETAEMLRDVKLLQDDTAIAFGPFFLMENQSRRNMKKDTVLLPYIGIKVAV